MKQKMNVLVLLALLISSLGFKSIKNHPDFTGNWIINKDRIEFGKVPEWVYPPTLSINQDQNYLRIDWTFLDEKNRQSKTSEKIPFDGTAAVALTPTGKHWSSIISKADGDTVAIKTNVTTADEKMFGTVKEKFYFDEDGESLMMERTVEHDGLVYTITVPYDKKQ